jgi:hypothetical protein
MLRNRQEVRYKELFLFSAICALASAFIVFSVLLIQDRGAVWGDLPIFWLIIAISIVGLLIARPYYVLLGLVAFTPFYPLARRLIENNTDNFGMIMGGWQDIVLGILILNGVIRVLKNKATTASIGNLQVGDFLFASLGIWALIGMLAQKDLFSALYGFRYTYLFIALYFAVLSARLDERQILILRHVIIATLLISALFGIMLVASDLIRGTRFVFDYQFYLTGKVDPIGATGGKLLRFGSTFVLSHGASPAYILLALFGLSQYYFEHKKTGWVIFLIGLLAVTTTMSRAGMGALLLSAAALLVFLVPGRVLFSRRSFPIFSILILSTLISFSFFSTLTQDYFLASNSGDSVRQNQLLMAVDSARDYPYGHGTGTAGTSLAIASRYLEGTFSGDTNVSDSFYLKVLYELGYPGLIFWTLGTLFMIGSLWKYFYSQQNEKVKSFIGTSIGYLIAIEAYSLTSNQLEIWPTKVYFWLIPALAILYSRSNDNHSAASQ